MSTEIAREIVARSTSIVPSPSLLRLEAELRSINATAPAIARLIERSPALTAVVLRMANSVFYSPREPVLALPRAVVMIGGTMLRQIVLHSMVSGRRATPRQPDDAYAAARLIGDAVRSAVVARDLARANKATPPDDAFVAGLLHDIGHILLVDEKPVAYAAYLASRQPGDSLDAEAALAGATHEQIGTAFAEAWSLPESLGSVMGGHHDHAVGPLAAIVRATDILVPGLSRPVEPWTVDGEPLPALAAIGVDTRAWVEGLPRLRDELAEMLTVFAVAF